MNSRSSGAIPVTRQALLAGLSCLPEGPEGQEGFKLKGGTEHGRTEALKAA